MTVLVVPSATSAVKTAMIGCPAARMIQLVSLEVGYKGCCLAQLTKGIYLGPDVDAWVWLGIGLEGLGPAAVDIEVLMGCIERLGWLDGGKGLTT